MILMKTRKTSEKVLAEKFSPDVTELDVMSLSPSFCKTNFENFLNSFCHILM